jgi:hypothetical protein
VAAVGSGESPGSPERRGQRGIGVCGGSKLVATKRCVVWLSAIGYSTRHRELITPGPSDAVWSDKALRRAAGKRDAIGASSSSPPAVKWARSQCAHAWRFVSAFRGSVPFTTDRRTHCHQERRQYACQEDRSWRYANGDDCRTTFSSAGELPRPGPHSYGAALSAATIIAIPRACQRWTALWSAPIALPRRRHGNRCRSVIGCTRLRAPTTRRST